jgi:hypothetical protein
MFILLIRSAVALLTISITIRWQWHESSHKPPQQIMKASGLSDASEKPIESLIKRKYNITYNRQHLQLTVLPHTYPVNLM